MKQKIIIIIITALALIGLKISNAEALDVSEKSLAIRMAERRIEQDTAQSITILSFDTVKEEISSKDAKLLVAQLKNWYANDPGYRKIVDLIESKVVSKLRYDKKYTKKTYEEALKSERGVCRHYALLVYDVLNKAGYQVEIWTSANHVWNHVVMPNGKTLYIDATWYDSYNPKHYDPWYITYDKSFFEHGYKGTVNIHGGWKNAKMIQYDAYNYYNMGMTYHDKQEYDRAIENFEKTIELQPDYVEAYYSIAAIYLSKSDYEKAIEYCKNTLESREYEARVYNCIGWSYAKMQDFDSAFVYCKKAIELDPKSAEAQHSVGYIYLNKGNYDMAIEYFKKTVELFEKVPDVEPYLAETYHDMGEAYERKGDKNKGLEYKKKAKKLGYVE
ncbi:MAG: tetratricopeptide repeat protein [Fibromonadales bacterium]|nr:tetratricopeptide repeat protein [Fibromonadales bacterium]